MKDMELKRALTNIEILEENLQQIEYEQKQEREKSEEDSEKVNILEEMQFNLHEQLMQAENMVKTLKRENASTSSELEIHRANAEEEDPFYGRYYPGEENSYEMAQDCLLETFTQGTDQWGTEFS